MAKSQPLIYLRSAERFEESLRECPEQPAVEMPFGWLLLWMGIGAALWIGLAWWIFS